MKNLICTYPMKWELKSVEQSKIEQIERKKKKTLIDEQKTQNQKEGDNGAFISLVCLSTHFIGTKRLVVRGLSFLYFPKLVLILCLIFLLKQ